MTIALPTLRRAMGWTTFLVLSILAATLLHNIPSAGAYVQFIQSAENNSNSTAVTATFPASATAGNVIIVVCGSKSASSTATVSPSGYLAAINQIGTPAQGIFYKVAAGGESAITCNSDSSSRSTVQIFEYRGLVAPVSGVTTSSGTSTNTTLNFGTVNATTSSSLLLASYIANTNTNPGSFTNSFTALVSINVGGNPGNRVGYGTATRTVTSSGSYSTSGTISATDSRGQIAAFPAYPSVLSTGFVDGSGNTIGNPSVQLTSRTTSFVCQSSTGDIGTASQKLRVRNMSTNGSWSVSMGPTGGLGATWSNGSTTYKYNSTLSDGCTEGRMTVAPGSTTITPSTGCTTTGITRGGVHVYNDTSTTSLLSGSGTGTNCYWDVEGIQLAQSIPAEIPAGTYSLNMTITGVSL